jgi:iron complex outermembrane receptor protein
VSTSSLDTRYGIPAEEGVYIDLNNRRTEALLELIEPFSGIESLRMRGADVRYKHQEIEAASGEIGTAFSSKGQDMRLEALHAPLGSVRGVFGVHLKQRELSASGEEAYIPTTQSREQALFYSGELPIGPASRGMRLEFGARAGRATLDPEAATGLPSRSFTLGSGSVAARLPVTASISTSLGIGVSERAPTIEELYANGPHAATATFELGDPTLGKERSRNVEWTLRGGEGGPLRWNVGIFAQHFSNYIAAFGTDVDGDGVADRVDDSGQIANSAADPGAGDFTQIAYRQARARFRGLEADVQWRPVGSPWGVRVFGDAVRGTVDGLGAAPRQPPMRLGFSADYVGGPWAGFLSVMHAASQDRTSVFETPTPGYTRVDAELSRQLMQTARGSVSVFVQARNLLNADIRLSTSFVKDTVPMPGRSVFAGLRVKL